MRLATLNVFRLTALASALIVSSAALPASAAPKKARKPVDEAAEATHKAWVDAVKDGTDKYAARDVTGAIEAFQKASSLEPRNPMGYYLLGEAEEGNRDLAQAESAWLHASQVSDEGPPGLKLKIFFVIADLRERQRRWDDAKAAWEQYGDLCAKFPEANAFPAVVKERIAMIDAMLTQDKAYEIVRQRIAEEKAHPPVPGK